MLCSDGQPLSLQRVESGEQRLAADEAAWSAVDEPHGARQRRGVVAAVARLRRGQRVAHVEAGHLRPGAEHQAQRDGEGRAGQRAANRGAACGSCGVVSLTSRSMSF